jgi:hypothetical protein
VEFGKRAQINKVCQDEALTDICDWQLRVITRLKAHEAPVFIDGCFQSCKPTIGYCTNAPKERRLLSDTGMVQITVCERRFR